MAIQRVFWHGSSSKFAFVGDAEAMQESAWTCLVKRNPNFSPRTVDMGNGLSRVLANSSTLFVQASTETSSLALAQEFAFAGFWNF
jgi:hypothetical protein